MLVCLLDGLLCGPVIIQNSFGIAVEDFSRAGRGDLPIVAFKELHIELFLHLLQVLAHGGLRHKEDFGRTGEVSRFTHNTKEFHLAYRHCDPRLPSLVLLMIDYNS